MTYSASRFIDPTYSVYRNSGNRLLDPEYLFANEVEGYLEGAFPSLSILESTGATYYTTLRGGDQSADLTLTLPTAYAATTGYVLSSTDAGVLSWVANAGTFAGGTITSDTTLDDGVGASPSLIFKDATDETATFSKADSGFLTLTTLAADGFGILGGNFKVGNGTPDVTQDGEDAYIEGTLEVDGAARFDGAVTAASLTVTAALTANGSITGDGGDALGGFKMTVTNDEDSKALNVNETGTVQTNAGASAAAAWVLPEAAAGLEYTFIVMSDQKELRVTPAAGDVIYINGVAGSAAEYWYADAVGESVHLIAVDNANWVAVSHIGTWAQGTPE